MNTVQPIESAANVTPALTSAASYTGERLLRLPQVMDMIGLSKSMVYKLMKIGEFPQPRKIHHATVWVESEVRNWILAIATQKRD